MSYQVLVLAADTGITGAPEALAKWVMGIVGAIILVFALIKGMNAMRDENLQRLIPVALVALCLAFFAYISFDSWKDITTNIGCDVLNLRLDECS